MKSERDIGSIINSILTILLIIAVLFAVQQRFFEDKKCEEWSRDKIFEISTGVDDIEHNCSLICHDNLASNMQNIKLADKSANYSENES